MKIIRVAIMFDGCKVKESNPKIKKDEIDKYIEEQLFELDAYYSSVAFFINDSQAGIIAIKSGKMNERKWTVHNRITNTTYDISREL